MAATVLNESKVPFLAPGVDNTRLQIVLDNNGVKFPRLEDSSGNVIANYSATTSVANPDGGGWLPIDANIKVGDQGINDYLTTNSKGLNQVTTSAIKNLTADEQAKYKELKTFPLVAEISFFASCCACGPPFNNN